ncbi:PAS domain S-box protein [Scytonema hofmannii PCC 7110]|uniref:PAS domain S-box protein n=1 Tax=Scytonema hofmannii PCC 7110 TaxID=128403 RepID=A0A139WS60_9CYAN|nr:MHYT domain-containing protein [Scytonema hofmannii]KYC35274.1 PAS domain S-box protein [Scytonema hofmannii PCC 7110]
MLSSSYDQGLVALSIVLAVLSSYTALDLAGRVSGVEKRVRVAWLIGGAITMGIGIWSMHFVAMLAFSLPIPIVYDVGTVVFSTLPAIVSSAGALFLASRRFLSMRRLLIGGMLMGLGIASMHYIGMAAMRMDASTHYDPLLFVLSVAIAIGASIAALYIAFQFRMQTSKSGRSSRILSALIMGAAIAGMHYTGMAAVSFTPTKVVSSVLANPAVQSSLTWLAIGIGIATLIILCFTLLTSFVDRRIASQTNLLKQQEAEAQRLQQFTDITLRIRRSLKLEDVLNTAVSEVQQALGVHRVIIHRLNRDWNGTIIAESVAQGWISTLGLTMDDSFWERYVESYNNGQVWVIDNIYEVGFAEEHLEILKRFQIKAYMAAPILQNNQLQGLLFAHQCSNARIWQKWEIELFRQLAVQISIALEQANLLHELQQAQEVLRLRDRAIAAASNGILITDPRQEDNPIVFCNAAFETMTGYSLEEVLGHNCRFLQGEGTDPATVRELNNAVKQERDCQVVIKNYCKDGTPFWNQLTISPVRDASGKVINFIGVQADITEQMQAQEELRLSKENLQSQVVELLNDVEEASRGDLTVHAQINTGEIGTVADFFNAIIESLRHIVVQVKQAVQQVNVLVGENSQSMRLLADDALKQAEEITHTLKSLDAMVLSIQAVADSAHQAAGMARTASTTAEVGRDSMERTVDSITKLHLTMAEAAKKVKRLGESSQEISKVVSLINQIALQTNIISINASIEAAKAGEEGLSFAVVAEEVGDLAARSAQATEEIQQIVRNIQIETSEVVKAVEQGMTQVVEGTESVKDAKQQLGGILEVSREIDSLVQSISHATVSQTQTSQVVVSLMKQIARDSLHTSDFSRLVSSSLVQTVDVAQQLQASVTVFKTDNEESLNVKPLEAADAAKYSVQNSVELNNSNGKHPMIQ